MLNRVRNPSFGKWQCIPFSPIQQIAKVFGAWQDAVKVKKVGQKMDHAVPFKATSLPLYPFVKFFSFSLSLSFWVCSQSERLLPRGQVSFSVNQNKMALSFHWRMFLKPRLAVLLIRKSAATWCKALITRNGGRQTNYDRDNVVLWL
jgi:hypothetical protein